MSFVDKQETTTTGKRKFESSPVTSATSAATTSAAAAAAGPPPTSNVSLKDLPLWVCAEIVSFLDLASVLNLTEVSVGVRGAFRTPVAAASIMAGIIASPCANHKIDLTNDSGDAAWTKLRSAFGNAWAMGVRTGCANGGDLLNCGSLIAAMVDRRFTAQNLHEQRCCRAAAAQSQASRRAAVVAALARLRMTTPENFGLVQAYIRSTLPLSLHQCIAQIQCAEHLRTIGAIDRLDRMIADMTSSKFHSNQPWLAMAAETIREFRPHRRRNQYYDDWSGGYDSEDYGQDEIDDGFDDEAMFQASLQFLARFPNMQFFSS